MEVIAQVPWMHVLRREPVTPADAVERLSTFVAKHDGSLHTDVLTQLQLVHQSIAEAAGMAGQAAATSAAAASASSSSPAAATAVTGSSSAADAHESEAVDDASEDKKKYRKLTKKALKKLPGGSGTCDEVCSAARKLDDAIKGSLSERVAAALKQLVKRKEAAKTGEKRGGAKMRSIHLLLLLS